MKETIQLKIKKNTWKKLMEMKIKNFDLKTFDDIINFLLNNFQVKK